LSLGVKGVYNKTPGRFYPPSRGLSLFLMIKYPAQVILETCAGPVTLLEAKSEFVDEQIIIVDAVGTLIDFIIITRY